MQIITVPNPKLRQITQPITQVDSSLRHLVKTLATTLEKKENPKGVGLAAPQIGSGKNVFVTFLPGGVTQKSKIGIFINPKLLDHSDLVITGETKLSRKPREEGCLSIPKIYGVVPRWQWAKFAYQEIKNNQLIDKESVFVDFAARVMQHEYDHLFGILFTDRILEHNLPVYKEINPDKWEEIDPELLTRF